MGENFISATRKQFRHLGVLGLAKLQDKTLFSSRPEVLNRAVDCELASSRSVTPGLLLMLIAASDRIDVWLGNQVVGIVAGHDSGRIQEALAEVGGSLLAVVCELSLVTNSFSVRITVGEDHE